jgi:hypothetical protein
VRAGRNGSSAWCARRAHQLDGQNGWRSQAEERPDGVLPVVTSADPRQAAIIQGLGFIGVMATGSHHQSTIWRLPEARASADLR